MVFQDRHARRVRRHLDEDEVVVVSVSGVEADGRRRRLIVVTDRRICVRWLRGDAPLELDLAGAGASYDRSGGLLTLRSGEHEVVLRAVDEIAARALVELLANHRHGGPTRASATPPRMRLLMT